MFEEKQAKLKNLQREYFIKLKDTYYFRTSKHLESLNIKSKRNKLTN